MIRSLASKYSAKARQARGAMFREAMNPATDKRILDLGGGTGAHFASICEQRKNVVIADVAADDLAEARDRGFETVQLDGGERLPFQDDEFDIVFCSSVIEHVTGPKDEIIGLRDGTRFKQLSQKHQSMFAAEIRRIGRSYFVQTPNRYFVVESHSWLPGLVAIAPRPMQVATIDFTNKFSPSPTSGDWNLLTRGDMETLFPEARVVGERALGHTKSWIAVSR